MTSNSPAGGRALESRDLTLALLASRLSEISEQLGRLAARVEAAEAAIGGHASLVATTSDLGAGGTPALSHDRRLSNNYPMIMGTS